MKEPTPDSILHVIFDRTTGRTVQTHRLYSAVDEAEVRVAEDEVLAAVDDEDLIRLGINREDLAVAVGTNVGINVRVDLPTMTVIPLSPIRLTLDRTQIEGDGEDNAAIEISVHRDDGSVDTSYEGQIRVTTTRGKLSAREGLVQMYEGHGSVSLRSTDETVAVVRVTAECVEHQCQPASVTLSFV